MRRTRILAGLAAGAALIASIAPPAHAADSVSQTVNSGTRTASVADLTLNAVAYNHRAQAQTGTMTLTADDSSGSGAGWNVTIRGSVTGNDWHRRPGR